LMGSVVNTPAPNRPKPIAPTKVVTDAELRPGCRLRRTPNAKALVSVPVTKKLTFCVHPDSPSDSALTG